MHGDTGPGDSLFDLRASGQRLGRPVQWTDVSDQSNVTLRGRAAAAAAELLLREIVSRSPEFGSSCPAVEQNRRGGGWLRSPVATVTPCTSARPAAIRRATSDHSMTTPMMMIMIVDADASGLIDDNAVHSASVHDHARTC